MTGRRRRHKPVSVFWGLANALPIILIPLSAFLFEARLHLGILTLDYEGRALAIELDKTQARIEELRAQVAELERLERIESEALELGLVMPEPNQILVVNAWTADQVWEHNLGFDVATGRSAPTGERAAQP